MGTWFSISLFLCVCIKPCGLVYSVFVEWKESGRDVVSGIKNFQAKYLIKQINYFSKIAMDGSHPLKIRQHLTFGRTRQKIFLNSLNLLYNS